MDAHDVVHVPDLKLNLLSVHKIVSQGNRCMISDVNGCRLVNKQIQVSPKCVLATGTQINGMYCLNCNQSCSCSAGHRKSLAPAIWTSESSVYASVAKHGHWSESRQIVCSM